MSSKADRGGSSKVLALLFHSVQHIYYWKNIRDHPETVRREGPYILRGHRSNSLVTPDDVVFFNLYRFIIVLSSVAIMEYWRARMKMWRNSGVTVLVCSVIPPLTSRVTSVTAASARSFDVEGIAMRYLTVTVHF